MPVTYSIYTYIEDRHMLAMIRNQEDPQTENAEKQNFYFYFYGDIFETACLGKKKKKEPNFLYVFSK